MLICMLNIDDSTPELFLQCSKQRARNSMNIARIMVCTVRSTTITHLSVHTRVHCSIVNDKSTACSK